MQDAVGHSCFKAGSFKGTYRKGLGHIIPAGAGNALSPFRQCLNLVHLFRQLICDNCWTRRCAAGAVGTRGVCNDNAGVRQAVARRSVAAAAAEGLDAIQAGARGVRARQAIIKAIANGSPRWATLAARDCGACKPSMALYGASWHGSCCALGTPVLLSLVSSAFAMPLQYATQAFQNKLVSRARMSYGVCLWQDI